MQQPQSYMLAIYGVAEGRVRVVALRNTMSYTARKRALEAVMAILHVRGVPDELYDQLQTLAAAQQRSLSAQVLAMLQDALEMEARREQQATLLSAIRRRRFKPPQGVPDTTLLLREDRER